MKLLFDFLPLILFFGTFKYAEGRKEWAASFASDHLGFIVSGGIVGPDEAPVLLATAVVVLATLAIVSGLLVTRRKVPMLMWVSLSLAVVLGGATVYFHSPTFMKWKPSVLYWVMSAALALSSLVLGKNLIQKMMGNQLSLPAVVWRRLNLAWIAFLAFMGVVNIWVAYTMPTSTWVDFKVFGTSGLMLVFVMAQGWYMSRHASEIDPTSPPPQN